MFYFYNNAQKLVVDENLKYLIKVLEIEGNG
jgi:hypothetical protein